MLIYIIYLFSTRLEDSPRLARNSEGNTGISNSRVFMCGLPIEYDIDRPTHKESIGQNKARQIMISTILFCEGLSPENLIRNHKQAVHFPRLENRGALIYY